MRNALLVICCLLFNHAHGQVKIYTGKINNKYAIEMHLLTVKNGMYGYYFYKTINNPIALHLSGKKNQHLVERDGPNEEVYFEILQNGKTICGNWHDLKNKKCVPFSVTESGNEKISTRAKKLNGSYTLDSIIQRDLYICSIHNNIIYFQLNVASGDCTGNLNGIANVYGNTAYYSGKDCGKLFLALYEKGVIISEKDCDNAHGKKCTFDGVYIRRPKSAR